MKLIALFLLILIFGVGITILSFFLIGKLRRQTLTDFFSKNIWVFIVCSAIITGAVCQNFFLLCCLGIATIVAALKISEHLPTSLANKIILSVYNYRQKNGRLPLNVDQLQNDKALVEKFKRNQTYSLDSSKQTFQVECWSDGWSTKTFYSIDSTWQTDD